MESNNTTFDFERNTKFEFQGLDHVALTVRDMKVTTDFYHHKLGMPILHTLEYENDKGEVIGQHYFFGVGDKDSHLALFWWRDGYQTMPDDFVPEAPKATNVRASPIGKLMHFNLRVDAGRIEEYCKKLAAEDIEFKHTVRYQDPERPNLMTIEETQNGYTEVRDGALMSSVYFSDPDGIMIEFNAWMPAWGLWPRDAVPMSADGHA